MLAASMSGEKYATYFGIRVRKVIVPILLLIFMKLTVPESSLSSHFFGILAAMTLKYCGFCAIGLLPSLSRINQFDDSGCFSQFMLKRV